MAFRGSRAPSSDIASQCSLRSGDMHSPLTPAFAGGYRFPMGRDARQAVGMPNPTSPSQPKKPRQFWKSQLIELCMVSFSYVEETSGILRFSAWSNLYLKSAYGII